MRNIRWKIHALLTPMTPFAYSLLNWLLNPHPRVTNPEKIQRSRLLSAILIVLIVLGVMILSVVINHDAEDIREPEVQGALLELLVVIAMYVVNRLGYNRYAVGGVVIPFVIVFIYIAFSSSGKSIFLAFLLIPILLTAIFFSLRWTTVISVSILALILLLLSFQDQVSDTSPFWTLRNMWFFLLLATGLLLTFMRHLGNLEQIRQEELKRINDELEQQVAELERFTYTVSHELKTPIVTIKGFLGIVEKDLMDGKFEKIKSDFARISKAADNMYSTLSDLLALSRVGRLVNPSSEFPLSELVQEAVESASGTIRSHNIILRVDPNLPLVYGDRQRLREVFENLIDNAAKYMGNQKQPLIEIGVKGGKEPVFFVRDNGMGIESQYQSKIFGLFDKLDPASEGTGVGLAIIKRIIENHGGKIWVESEGLGKGSIFYFTLPERKQ
jgi:signal transduction histidine kinase